MENPLISIIVPVYNVEQYLEQCLDSLISQTYRNIEIILIDDGSSDKSPEICEEYGRKDSRIKIIHKSNGGPAEARNVGTIKANGSYIAYVDSDDWVHPKYIEFLYNLLLENNADISICDYVNVIDHAPIEKKEKEIVVKKLDNKEAVETLLYQKDYETNPYCKLYSSNIAKLYLYPKGRLYEDLFTTYKMMFIARKIVYGKKCLYYYRDNPNGIMNKKFTPKMFDELDAVNEMETYMQGKCPELLPAVYSRKFSSYSQVLRWTKDAPNTKEIQEKRDYIWNFLKKYQWKMFFDRKARLKNRLAALLMIFGQKNYIKF